MGPTAPRTKPTILFVHGMRMHNWEEPELFEHWYDALLALLAKTEWGKRHPQDLPKADDIAFAYWADLFRRPNFDAEATKGFDLPTVRDVYYTFLRGLVRGTDWLAHFDDQGRPRDPAAFFADGLVNQTATYMHNGPVFHPDPKAG